MNKLVIAVIGAVLTASTLPVFAANNNAQQNAAANAGMEAPGSHEQMAPNGTDGNGINMSSGSMNNGDAVRGGNGTPSQQMDTKTPSCAGANCTNNMGSSN